MSQDVPAQKVTAGWDKERIFTVTTETGFDVKMDPGGPKPTEMLLGSLAACAGMTLLDILDKMRLEVTDLEVKAEGKRSEEKPGEFVEFSLIIMIKGENLPPDRIGKAVEKAEAYCPVLQTFAPAVPVRTRYVLG